MAFRTKEKRAPIALIAKPGFSNTRCGYLKDGRGDSPKLLVMPTYLRQEISGK
jgi:hypothetical protein